MIRQLIIVKIFLLLVAFTIFASCSKQEPLPKAVQQETERGITIGFSIDTFVIERWQRDCDVFIATANALGADVIVQTAGNSAENQNKQIQYLIERGVDALVIVPKEAGSLSDVLKLAKASNIPVISYDRLITGADISLYITIDSRRVGELMAESLAAHVPSGNYICIYGAQEDYNMQMATQGVHAVFARYPGIRVLEEYYTPDWNFDMAYSKMSELLDSGSIPNAVICGNDAMAERVLHALAEHRISGVAVSGQDADIAGCQRVVEGLQTMTVYKPITILARKAAENAVSFAKHHKAADEEIDTVMNNGYADVPAILLEPTAVSKDNIDEVIVQSGFHTKNEVYRIGIAQK
ncbi:MAG: substrate-binding domain-containing protein [Treponema sp.]|nr:substrate-binding domain-containing protein [Treponema sp.]